ncbi:MAG TPA: DegV family protein [Tissierellaceae bacterium]|nr:DegV family protein [Tissierellaceae bacterium]
MTKIIMDSTADLPKDLINKYQIDILPLRLSIGDKEYIDKVTISLEEVYDAMRNNIYPKTSQPNPKTSYDLFETYASQGKDFIFFSFSSKLSSTYQTSYLIIKELKSRFPQVKMDIIDTKGGSFASGLIALQAAIMSKEKIEFEDIVRISRSNVLHVEHIFTIDDLDWLVKGGRIKKSEAIVGKTLNIKPILEVQDGKMIVIDKIRGRKRALKTVVDLVEERIEKFPNQIVGITHADDLGAANRVKNLVQEKIGPNNILVEKIGSVLGSHLGIGGVGVFFLNNKPEFYVSGF